MSDLGGVRQQAVGACYTWTLSKRELSSRLTQVLTGHRYTGEYYAKMNIPDKSHSCPSDGTTFQTRDRLIRDCPLYETARNKILMPVLPRLHNPRFSLGSLFKRKSHSHLITWLDKSGAFTKVGWNPASNSEGGEGFVVREVQGRRAPLNPIPPSVRFAVYKIVSSCLTSLTSFLLGIHGPPG